MGHAKAKKSIQRAHQLECPDPPHRSPWLPRSPFGQDNSQNNGPGLQGHDNKAFEGDKSIRRQVEKFQLGERTADSITLAPEYIDMSEETPMFTENDPIYMEIPQTESPEDHAQTVTHSQSL